MRTRRGSPLVCWLAVAGCAVAGPSAPEPQAEALPARPAPAAEAIARGPAAGPRASPSRPPETTLLLGGDVLTSEALRDAMEATGDPAGALADALQPLRRRFDDTPGAFVLLNLESPVARRRRNPLLPDPPGGAGLVPVRLMMPPWVLAGLRRAGVDAISLANNHALDQDREGLAETLDAAHATGLVTLGAGRAPHLLWPAVVGQDGARTAVLAFYDGRRDHHRELTGEAGRAHLEPPVLERVRDAARRHDAVVVTVHVLGELRERPKPRWRRWARALAEAGADVVVVHGTHVVMPIELLEVGERTVPLAWGLGNFVSDMAARSNPRRQGGEGAPKAEHAEAREALVARVRVRPNGQVQVDYLPIFTLDDRFVLYHGGRDAPVRFRVVPLAACGRATDLPESWPPALRQEMADWIDSRRDHLLAVSGLAPGSCRPGEARWLTPGGLR